MEFRSHNSELILLLTALRPEDAESPSCNRPDRVEDIKTH